MDARLVACICACAALACIAGHGQGRETHVPGDLQDWQDWVLHGEEHRRCPFLYNSAATTRGDFICAWPGQLDLSVAADGGRFEQAWTVHGDEQWVPLPGSGKIWPRQVTVAGSGVEVVLRDGVPSIRLQPGKHQLNGAFAWDERPAMLDVPRQSGLLALTVDGQRIVLPRRTDQGLWLGGGETTDAVQDQLSTNVYRLVADDVPTRLETVFEITVAGKVREELIAPALPEGFVPLSLDGELPVRLSPDGDLEIQVRPGTWRVTLKARALDVVDSLTLPQGESNLPGTEVWSYQASPRLRATLPEALRSVDPTQVGSPWPGLPAFRMEPGESLVVVERSRGLENTGNALSLDRELWLDFDGDGFVFADSITGTMRHGWRLDMAAPYALMNAREQGETLLVTRDDALDGVEVRSANLDLDALGRIDTRGEIPVAGWQADLNTVNATLNVPPGHKLLAALGVDDAPSSWFGRWRLLDFFLLLIITLASARLFGRVAGAVAFVAMAIGFHEPFAPLWTWLNLLAAVALVRVAPPGRLQSVAKGYRVTSFVVLLLFLVPFAVGQIRIAIFPQLESPLHRDEHAQTWGLFEILAGRPMPAPEVSIRTEGMGLPKAEVRMATDTAPRLPRYDDDALLQTGPGKPDWNWRTYSLSWSGPVDTDRSMRLVILSDWLVSTLRLIAIVALGLFAALFAFDIANRRWRWRLPAGKGVAGATSAVFLAIVFAGAEPASAEPPSRELLDELKERLLAEPPCAPRCAEIVDAEVDVAEDAMTIRLAVHAMQDVAVPMPGTGEGWRPQRIRSGESDLHAYRDAERVLWVHLPAGRHNLTLTGPLPTGDTLEIPFAALPRAIAARSEHWFVAGIQDRILPAGALNLTRLREPAREGQESETEAVARWEPSRLPVFLRVDRAISLGLDWVIFNVASRVSPETGALNVDVPLLEGEAVLDEDTTVGADGVAVSMGPTDRRFVWSSSLARASSMTLQAPTDRPWHEVWMFYIDNEWKVEFEGMPESLPDEQAMSRVAVFHPRPGESLTVSISRPGAVQGNTLAFDGVKVSTTVGGHQRRSVMAIDYRSTRGTSHVIRLPAAAQVESVRGGSGLEPIVAVDGEVTVPILPGEHAVSITWNEASSPGLRIRTPDIELGAPSSNLVSELTMPSNRWLLFAHGPDLGPAVLYWSELVALILASLILGRLKWTPLRTHHWLLLGLGFSTSSWLAMGVVGVWLLAHGSRRYWGAKVPEAIYRLSQIGFGMLTLAAFAAIVAGIGVGLLGNPDMHILGYGSAGSELRWFADRTQSAIPEASVYSVPLWVYKALILAWALWLSFVLIRWLPWVWQRFAEEGLWYRAKPAGDAEAA